MRDEVPPSLASDPVLLAELERGGVVESQHRGYVALVDGEADRQCHLGNLQYVTFLRSSAKPFQALLLVTSGAADRFQFSDRELAIACGSHTGTAEHVSTVEGILQKIGLDRSALHCGRRNSAASVIQDNCSGKHAGMLAVCRHRDDPIANYTAPGHPVQKSIIEIIAKLAALPVENIRVAVDGCAAPTFAIPIARMARMFARLVRSDPSLPVGLRNASQRIVGAMINHPQMVAGDGELDTELMKIAKGRIVVKSGAEGLFAVGVFPSPQWPTGAGMVFKIEDGSGRARPVVAVELLRQLNLLSPPAVEELACLFPSRLLNRSGEVVGSIRPMFQVATGPPNSF